jgi:uncharacterized protein YprB with RNaseH-like and TPR domain
MAFDIETEPNDALIPLLEESLTPPANYKSQDAIEKWKAGALEEAVDKMTLDGNFGRVISCHYAIMHEGRTDEVDVTSQIKVTGDDVTADEAETKLLDDISDMLIQADQLVSYNGSTFDIPFLRRRCQILGVRFPAIECSPYRVGLRDSHCDMMHVLSQPSNPLKLRFRLVDHAKRILGIDEPEEHKQKTAYRDWFRNGEFDKLRDAGEWDVITTLELFLRCLQTTR